MRKRREDGMDIGGSRGQLHCDSFPFRVVFYGALYLWEGFTSTDAAQPASVEGLCPNSDNWVMVRVEYVSEGGLAGPLATPESRH